MNLRRVAHILGTLVLILAGAELLPLVWCLAEQDRGDAVGFLAGAAITGALGGGLRGFGSREGELYRREGVLIVVGAWLLASATGAIPYLATGAIAHPVDALFESASGFTTTGASILVDIEGAGHPVLFWRSFTQWLGGIGIVVLFVALFSELGPGARFLFKLEVPGPQAEMLRPRVQETAAALFRIYLVLTGVQALAMMALGVSLYDAVTHAFSTVSTGGFSPYADSAGHFSSAVQLVILVFMLAAGVNFSLYYTSVRRRSLVALRDTELRFYAGLFFAGSVVIGVSLVASGRDVGGETLLAAAFQVGAILTTTGFASEDFAQWPPFSREALVLLMIGGGCAGSTAGGAKLVRLIVGWRAALREVRLTFSPNAVIAITLGREAVPESSVGSVVGLLVLWMAAWAAGAMLLAVGDIEIATAATAAIATLSNVGPGLAAVGPSGNFAFFAPWQKCLMVFLMLLGRLEFFAAMALLQRKFWEARMSVALAGERVVLRPWSEADEAALVRHADDRAVWRNLRDRFPHPYGPDEARTWIRSCREAPEPPCNLAITFEGEAVGGVGVEPLKDIDRVTGEVGYWLGQALWGRGLASEALGLFTDYAFERLGFRRLEAHVLAWNPASGRVLEKAGYVREAWLRGRSLKDGELVDNWLYARLRD